MGESRPLLIRRDAQRSLSLAIACFLAIPAFAVGALSLLWPLGRLLPHDCPADACPAIVAASLTAPFVAAAILGMTVVAIAALGLYWLTYRRPHLAWGIVVVIGCTLVATALAADLAVGAWDLAIVMFVWPMTPGLIALDAALRAHRSSASS